MRNESLIVKILIVIYGIAVVAFSIMSTVIYVYTIYYYAVDNGFWGAIYGMFLPGFSSITLFFDLIGLEGFFNNFTTMVIIWLVSVVVLAIPMFAKNKN